MLSNLTPATMTIILLATLLLLSTGHCSIPNMQRSTLPSPLLFADLQPLPVSSYGGRKVSSGFGAPIPAAGITSAQLKKVREVKSGDWKSSGAAVKFDFGARKDVSAVVTMGAEDGECALDAFVLRFVDGDGNDKWVKHVGNINKDRYRVFTVRPDIARVPQLNRFAPVNTRYMWLFPFGSNNPCLRATFYTGNTLLTAPPAVKANVDGTASIASLNVVDNGCGYVQVDVSCDKCTVRMAPLGEKSGILTASLGDSLSSRGAFKRVVGPARDVAVALAAAHVSLDDPAVSGSVTVRASYAPGKEGHGVDVFGMQEVIEPKMEFSCTKMKCTYMGACTFPKCKQTFSEVSLGYFARRATTYSNIQREFSTGVPPGLDIIGTSYFVQAEGRVSSPVTGDYRAVNHVSNTGALFMLRPPVADAVNPFSAANDATAYIVASDGQDSAVDVASPKAMKMKKGYGYDFWQTLFFKSGHSKAYMKYLAASGLEKKAYTDEDAYRCLHHEESVTVDVTHEPTPPPALSLVVAATPATTITEGDAAAKTFMISLNAAPAKDILIGHESAIVEGTPQVLTFTAANFGTPQALDLRVPNNARRDPTYTLDLARPSCRGNAADGALVVIAREHVLSVAAYIVADSLAGSTFIDVESAAGIAAGDELMIYQTQHATLPGMYQFADVASVSPGAGKDGSDRITVAGAGGLERDVFSGLAGSNPAHTAQAVRVGRFSSVRVGFGGRLTARAWDGKTGGVLAIRSQTIIETQFGGVIDVSALGFRGGGCGACADTSPGFQGESHCGIGVESTAANCNGGGGGSGVNLVHGSAGGSGGNLVHGSHGSSDDAAPMARGGARCAVDTAGDPAKATRSACLGGGGGGAGDNDNAFPVPVGGAGGGFVYAYAREWSRSAVVLARGADSVPNLQFGSAPSGAGAGGSIVVGGAHLPDGGFNATGGAGWTDHDDWVGPGGHGRVQMLTPEDCYGDGTGNHFSSVDLTVLDDGDTQVSLAVSPAISTTLVEGEVYLHTVTLDAPPPISAEHPLRVDISAVGGTDLPIIPEPSSLLFTAEDYSVPHTFMLDVSDDSVVPLGTIVDKVRLTAHDALDTEILAAPIEVDVTIVNDDQPGLAMSPVIVEEPRFSSTEVVVEVALRSKPTADVTVKVPTGSFSSHSIGTTADLVFEVNKWDELQSFTVTVKRDGVNRPSPHYLSGTFFFSGADDRYNALHNETHDFIGVTDYDRGAITYTSASLFYAPRVKLSSQYAGELTTIEITMRLHTNPIAATAEFRVEMPMGYAFVPGTTAATILAGVDGALSASAKKGTEIPHLDKDVRTMTQTSSTALSRSQQTGETLVLKRVGGTTRGPTVVVIRVTGLRLPLEIGHRSFQMDSSKPDTFAIYVTQGSDASYVTHGPVSCVTVKPSSSIPVTAVPIIPTVTIAERITERNLREGIAVLKLKVAGATWSQTNAILAPMVNAILGTIAADATVPNGWNALTAGMFSGSHNPKRSLSKDLRTLSIKLPKLPTYGVSGAEKLTFRLSRDAFDVSSDMYNLTSIPSVIDCIPVTGEAFCSRVARSYFLSVPTPVVREDPPVPYTVNLETLVSTTALVTIAATDAGAADVAWLGAPAPHTHVTTALSTFSLTPKVTGPVTLVITTDAATTPDSWEWVASEAIEINVKDTVTTDLPPMIPRSAVPHEVTATLGVGAAGATVRMYISTDPPAELSGLDETENPAVLFVSAQKRTFSVRPLRAGPLKITLTPGSGIAGGKDSQNYLPTSFTTHVTESFTSNLPPKMAINTLVPVEIALSAAANMSIQAAIVGNAEFRFIDGRNASTVTNVTIIGEDVANVALYSSSFGKVTIKVTPIGGEDASLFLASEFVTQVAIPIFVGLPEKVWVGERIPGEGIVVSAAQLGDAVFSARATASAVRSSIVPSFELTFNRTENNLTDPLSYASVGDAVAAAGVEVPAGNPLNVTMNSTVLTSAVLALSAVPRACGPIELSVEPVAGVDAPLFADATGSTFAYHSGESAVAEIVEISLRAFPSEAAAALFVKNATEYEIAHGGARPPNRTATVKAGDTVTDFEAELPAGFAVVIVNLTFDSDVCAASIEGIDVLALPDSIFAIPLSAPRKLEIKFTAGDAVTEFSGSLTLARHCDIGYFLHDDLGTGHCSPCPKHSTTESVDTVECTECDTGYYTPAAGSALCQPCDFVATAGGPYPGPKIIKTGLGSIVSYVPEDGSLALSTLVTVLGVAGRPPYDPQTSAALLYHVTLAVSLGTISLQLPADPTHDVSMAPADDLSAGGGPKVADLSEAAMEEERQAIGFMGSADSINSVLASTRLAFKPPADYHGPAALFVHIDDVDGVGCSPEQNSTVVIEIEVRAVNDPPVIDIGMPGSGGGGGNSSSLLGTAKTIAPPGATTLTVDEDSSVQFARMIRVSDVDMATVPGGKPEIKVTLDAIKGLLILSDLAGVNVNDGGSGESKISFSGPPTAVQRVLDTDVVYAPFPDYNGADRISVLVTDLGSYPAPEERTSAQIAVTVKPVNDVQTISEFSAFHGAEDSPTELGGVSVNDIDQDSTSPLLKLRVRMTVGRGALQLGSVSGLTNNLDGGNPLPLTAQAQFDFNAKNVDGANKALSGLRYIPPDNFAGSTTMVLTVTDIDTGVEATRSAVIIVSNADDPTTAMGYGDFAEGSVYLSRHDVISLGSVRLSDVEAAATPSFEMTVAVSSGGKLSLNESVTALGFHPTAVSMSDTSFTGSASLDVLNAALVSLHYENSFSESISDILEIKIKGGARTYSWTIKTCPAGQYLDLENGRQCMACRTGRFTVRNGEISCARCPAGSVQPLQGQRSCTPCNPGFEAPVEGLATCSKCRAGFHRANATDVQCIACNKGFFSAEAGAIECERCPPGTFNSGQGFSQCISCIAGTFSPGGAADCRQCPAGSFAVEDGASECIKCPKGRFQADIGQTKCIECPVDTFASEDGSATCSPCSSEDKNTRGKTGSMSELDCECKVNTFGPPGPGLCSSCPRGGRCVEGATKPDVVPGFWSAGEDDTEFFQCIPAHACLGSSNSTRGDSCATGYTGFRCGDCVRTETEKYYRIGDECVICPESTGWSMVLLFVLFCIVAALLMVFGKAGVRFGTVQIGINFFQMLSLFSGFRLSWPPLVVDFFSWMGIFAFNVEVLHPECEVQMSYFQKTLLFLSLPFFFLALFGSVFLVYVAVDNFRFRRQMAREGHDPSSMEYRDAEIRCRDGRRRMFFLCCASLTILLSILYATLTTRSLQFFDCTLQHNGKYMMDASPTDECFSDEWYRYLWVGIFGVVAYVVAWPVVLAMCVNRARLDSHVRNIVMQVFSPLLSNYRSKYLGWELTVIMRKATIITATLFFTESALYQTIGGLIVLIFSVIIHAHGKPFIEKVNNVSEGVSLVCALLILLFGLVVFPGEPTETEYEHIGYIIIMLACIAIAVLIMGALSETVNAWQTLRRAVDFRKYTSEENILCLRRVINPSDEGRVRDWLQHSYEAHRQGLHDNLWALLRDLSTEVMKYNAEKKVVKEGGELVSTASMSEGAIKLRQLLFSHREAQAHLTSTHVVNSFCGSMLQEAVVPPIREWLRSRAAQIERGTASPKDVTDFQNFVVTMTSIELHNFRQMYDSKELWHADQETKAAAMRSFKLLEEAADLGGGGDGTLGSAISTRVGVLDIAPVDRAVTSLLIPLMYGPFGSSWLKTMSHVTESEDLSSLSLYRQTLHDLQRAYLAQLFVNEDYTPSMRFMSALPRKYRKIVTESWVTANDDISEEEETTDTPTRRRKGVHHANTDSRRTITGSASKSAVLGDLNEEASSETEADDTPSVDTKVSILGVGINIPQWPFFGSNNARAPPELATTARSDDESDDEESFIDDQGALHHSNAV